MSAYQGKSISKGIAIGPAMIFKKGSIPDGLFTERAGSEAEKEVRVGDELVRLEQAIDQTRKHMDRMVLDTGVRVGREAAQIFLMHKLILDGKEFVNLSRICIEDGHMSAEAAVRHVGEALASRFEGMDDEYMQSRADDMRDIANEIISILRESADKNPDPGDAYPHVLVAESVLPSDVAALDRDRVLAIVTVEGSTTSHATILAHMMDIPMVVGVPLPLDDIEDGTPIYVNADTGEVIVRPDVDFTEDIRERSDPYSNELKLLIGKKTITTDGRCIDLFANIASMVDMKRAMSNDAEGIGLYRSEFMFMDRETPPDEEEQYAVYTRLLSMCKGKPVTVRTMDIGGDKTVPYIDSGDMRGIRVSLAHPDLLRTQFRALVRASVHGILRVMYPMVNSVEDVKAANSILGEVKWSLLSEVGACNLSQGIMIETVEAADAVGDLAECADFISIGTNDLIQSIYGADRQKDEFYKINDGYEKLFVYIRQITEAAHLAGISVSVCGEIASDREYTLKLIDAGVDRLSVAPSEILRMREHILHIPPC